MCFSPSLQHAVLACERDPLDPMERAIRALGAEQLDAPLLNGSLVHEYGLSPGLPVMTHVWDLGAGGAARIAAKGAPESVADLCRLSGAERDAVLARP